MSRDFFSFKLVVLGSLILSPTIVRASDEQDTVLDPAPFSTARANAMGGALSTIADDLDAIYYNPAGIGGLGFDKTKSKAPLTRSLVFPYSAVTLNDTANTVRKEFNAKSAQSDANAGAAILDANSGKRQFIRATVMPVGILVGRTVVAQTIDHQIAAVPVADSPGAVKLRYRTFSGLLVGTSVSDYASRVAWGVSQSIGTIQETYGTFQYVDAVDVNARKEIFSENRKTYKAGATNIGMTIRPQKKLSPTFAVVARNMGNSKNRSTNEAYDDLIFDEDLTVGASISPKYKKLRINAALEASHLTQKHIPAIKKFRAGLEVLVGGDNSKAPFGFRLGGTEAGISYGTHLNLGLIGLEAESHATNIGFGGDRVIERRNSVVLFVDVGSF
ncbi:MAG: hypothetical protein WCL28_08120 [bacterium]